MQRSPQHSEEYTVITVVQTRKRKIRDVPGHFQGPSGRSRPAICMWLDFRLNRIIHTLFLFLFSCSAFTACGLFSPPPLDTSGTSVSSGGSGCLCPHPGGTRSICPGKKRTSLSQKLQQASHWLMYSLANAYDWKWGKGEGPTRKLGSY